MKLEDMGEVDIDVALRPGTKAKTNVRGTLYYCYWIYVARLGCRFSATIWI